MSEAPQKQSFGTTPGDCFVYVDQVTLQGHGILVAVVTPGGHTPHVVQQWANPLLPLDLPLFERVDDNKRRRLEAEAEAWRELAAKGIEVKRVLRLYAVPCPQCGTAYYGHETGVACTGCEFVGKVSL